MKKTQEQKGMALLLAILILAVVFSVSLTIVDFVVKQFNIANTSRDSVNAIYAADTGIECALLWDIRGREPGFYGEPIFATSTESVYPSFPSSDNIICLNTDISAVWTTVLGTNEATPTFLLDFPTINACSDMEVAKFEVAGVINTTMLSRGYNVPCASRTTALRAVERAIRVRYIFN